MAMRRALIVSAGDKQEEVLTSLLREAGVQDASRAHSAREARGLSLPEFSIVVINAPLPDEGGCALAAEAAGGSSAGVVLLAREEEAEALRARMEPLGVFVVEKPLRRAVFAQTVRCAQAACERLLAMEKRNRRLQVKLDEIKLVTRAKLALMQYLSMSEEQAHRYIEKQAMDLRVSKTEVARSIMLNYGVSL